MRSCFSPLLKEVLDEAHEQPPFGLVPIPLPLCHEDVDHAPMEKTRDFGTGGVFEAVGVVVVCIIVPWRTRVKRGGDNEEKPSRR
ncbi:hypothetical protein VNO80_25245 [Phaseolus coccineus]|uniref:Uncharacterized protein n=1 Tax=Phaseolus coccineus TaxID=3886 RepID=A0AAN9LY85_PHACN